MALINWLFLSTVVAVRVLCAMDVGVCAGCGDAGDSAVCIHAVLAAVPDHHHVRRVSSEQGRSGESHLIACLTRRTRQVTTNMIHSIESSSNKNIFFIEPKTFIASM